MLRSTKRRYKEHEPEQMVVLHYEILRNLAIENKLKKRIEAGFTVFKKGLKNAMGRS